ncbi:MAG: methionine--tRNA ligase subunit beta [Patescibacteria group bacterium]|nr:methionine--tRNA ligase subunit beta [Patescibacteria group bacterium]
MIGKEEFQKIDLRVGKIWVGKILTVEEIEASDKLFKIKVDLGDEKRTIVSGIKKNYSAEELLGQLIVLIINLEPRQIRGIVSEAMLLAAASESGPVLIVPLNQVRVGSKIS